MFQVVEPRESAADYKDIVAGVYCALVAEKGQMSGHSLAPGDKTSGIEFLEVVGVKPLIKFFASVNSAFNQYSLNIENMVAKGEKVMVKYSLCGIPTSKILGLAPTGGSVRLTGLDIFRLDHGKVVEYWNASHQIEPAR